MIRSLLISFFFYFLFSTFSIAQTSLGDLQLTLEIYNRFHHLNGAVTFIYENETLVYSSRSSAKGISSFPVQLDKKYKLVISMSAHQTVIINLNTQRVPPELVKKLRIPVLLLHLSDQDASGEPIQFSIKWNPILERFESFEVNMGWKEELQTLP